MERITGYKNCRRLMLWFTPEISACLAKKEKHWISLIGSAICLIATRYSFVATMTIAFMEPISAVLIAMCITYATQELKLTG